DGEILIREVSLWFYCYSCAICSYLTNEDVNPNVANNGKKRKLPAEVLEELGFRSSKQKCHKGTVAAQCDSLPTEMWQEGDNHGHKYAGKEVFNAEEEVVSLHAEGA
ncbi:hypothetical protein Drorol1_Dr00012417, partial [Drosera rotundifolia]